jgi:vacuolar-type H+-ATPase subunit H
MFHIAFKDATDSLKRIFELEEKAKTKLSEARKQAEEKIKEVRGDNAFKNADDIIIEEDGRRADVVAARIGGTPRRAMNLLNPVYSHKAAQKAADKIRFAETKKGRKITEEKKDATKLLKQLLKQQKELQEEEVEKPARVTITNS